MLEEDLIKEQKKELERKNNEIKNTKDELEKIFEGTQDNMFLVKVKDDNTFEYVRSNKAHQISTGIPLEEIRGNNPIDLLGDELGNTIKGNFIKCLKSKEHMVYEEIVSLPSGRKIWNVSLTPLIKNGKVTHIIGSRQDITSRKEAENNLKKSRKRLRSIIETTQDGFWIIGKNQRIVDVNEAYCNMTGYTREELLNLTISDLDYSDSPGEVKKRIKIILDVGHQIFETKHVKKNGEVFDVEISVSCLNKNPIEMLCFCRDITSKKQDKQKLIDVKERLENIIEGTDVGTWERNLHTGEATIDKKWAGMLGYKIEELLPMNTNAWRNLIYTDDLEKAEEEIQKLIDKEIEHYDVEFRMNHKNGKLIWVNGRGKITKLSPEGKPLLISGTTMNISERKEAEEELIHSHDLIKYILKHNTSGVAVHDKDMKYMYVSQRYLDRYKIEEKDVIGKHHYEIFPDLPQKWRDVHKRSLKGEVISKDEDPYYREDGSIVWTKWESRPWYEKDGSIGGIIIYTEVITDQKEMEAKIYKEREQFKTTLLSVGDAIISTNKQGEINVMNNVAENLTGWKKEEARGKPLEEVLKTINEFTRKESQNPAKKALKLGKVVEMENHTILISKDGKEIPIEDSAAPIKDRDGQINGAVIVFRDFTEKRKKQKEIEYLSFHDNLTGLYNRRYMEDSIKRLDTNRNLPLSIIVADVNGLKLTNDAYGHKMGDRLLKVVGKILKKSCRQEDIICRVGGDEFLILLPNVDEKKSENIIERVTKESQSTKLDSVIISLALGSATKNSKNKNILEVYKEADNKMYKNKLKYGRIMRNKTIETVLINLNNKYDNEQIHTERVSQYCVSIAEAMNLTNKEIEDAKIAGALHDIGKIVVPPEILNKKSGLNEDDWETIKKHSATSYQLLKSVDEYAHLAEAVLYHHEKLDGSGYPEGLKDKEIPLLSKIITVADAYEAMTANRPYQRKKNKLEAVEELKKYSGSQFDKDIVEIFTSKVL